MTQYIAPHRTFSAITMLVASSNTLAGPATSFTELSAFSFPNGDRTQGIPSTSPLAQPRAMLSGNRKRGGPHPSIIAQHSTGTTVGRAKQSRLEKPAAKVSAQNPVKLRTPFQRRATEKRNQALDRVHELRAQGISVKEAARIAASETGYSASYLRRAALSIISDRLSVGAYQQTVDRVDALCRQGAPLKEAMRTAALEYGCTVGTLRVWRSLFRADDGGPQPPSVGADFFLTPHEIDAYVSSGQPLPDLGPLGIEEALLLDEIQDDFSAGQPFPDLNALDIENVFLRSMA
jgi:uncharacterized protein YoaH (UPF0181 family)